MVIAGSQKQLQAWLGLPARRMKLSGFENSLSLP
ncbi:hypothetical protein BCF44_13184 [Kutzneria buriramensis]|uniref:Uncharacterized protein n=1 Tax=Kutzneria buriramensis TaxID=1045776 RepID=A0A3E0GV99_9PSEU|nr:hypothetical protein BCF44_13184 [Kutzneria buriramensis]